MKMNEVRSSIKIEVGDIGEGQDCGAETEYMEETKSRAASKQKVVNYLGHQKCVSKSVNIVAIGWEEILPY